jgi:uncharacterized membrane protein YdjX (TVP38/TMEM64 family)
VLGRCAAPPHPEPPRPGALSPDTLTDASALVARALHRSPFERMLIDLATSLDALGPAGPTAVVLAAIACGLLCLPIGAWVTACGFWFGFPLGASVGVIAALGVALANFTLARRMGGMRLLDRLRRRPAVARFGRTLGRDGGLVLGLLRLSPIVSWPALSYAAGLGPIRWRSYLTSCLGMLPLAMLYAWIGAKARDMASDPQTALDMLQTWAAPIGLVLVVLALAVALRTRPDLPRAAGATPGR